METNEHIHDRYDDGLIRSAADMLAVVCEKGLPRNTAWSPSCCG